MEEAGGKEQYLAQLKNMGLNDKTFTDLLMQNKLTEKLYQKMISEDERYKVTDEDVNKYYDENYNLFKSQPFTI